MLLLPYLAGADFRGVSDPHVMSQRRDHLHEPLAVPGRFHADQCRRRNLPVEPFRLSSGVFQLFLLRFPCGCFHPTNLLPTGVIITSNKHHRRLLPTEFASVLQPEAYSATERSLRSYPINPAVLRVRSLILTLLFFASPRVRRNRSTRPRSR